MTRPPREEVADYYRGKTGSILEKYGPGPRVHFHTGLVAPSRPPADDLDTLRRQLVEAQEAMVVATLGLWDSPELMYGGRVLDCGLGLGGPALFWAEHYQAQVTGVTLCEEHVGFARAQAEVLGLSDSTRFLVRDVCEPALLEAIGPMDVAVAFEAACHFEREAWLANMGECVRPGGRLLVADVFLGEDGDWEAMRDYWHIDLITVDALTRKAGRAGFGRLCDHELTRESAGFWPLSVAWSRARGRVPGAPDERLARSEQEHARMFDEWQAGRLRYHVLCFERLSGRTR